jgi:hypothetical protein
MSSTTATHTAVLPHLVAALVDGSRVLADLAAQAQEDPSARSLDQFLSQARGLALTALRAHRQLGGDPVPPPPRDPLAPIGRAA